MGQEITFDVDEAMRLFEATPSWRKVARQLGVHPYSLQSKLSSLGCKVDPDFLRIKIWSDRASQLREEGQTYKQIGELLAVSPSTVQREMVRKHGKGGKPNEGEGVD